MLTKRIARKRIFNLNYYFFHGKDLKKMSQFTKKAIMDSFIELSQEMPIDKITIKKVTQHCGINRNTFYYYYQDMYSLKEEIIYTKTEKLLSNASFNSFDSWQSSLRFIGAYAQKNELFIKNMFNSMGRDAFGDYMVDVAYKLTYPSIQNIYETKIKIHGKKISEKELERAAYFFAKVFAETTVEWLRGKSSENPVDTLEHGIGMLDGIIEAILLNLTEKR